MRVAMAAPAAVLGVLRECGVVPAARAPEVVGDRDQVVHGGERARARRIARGGVARRHDVRRQVEALQREVDLVRGGGEVSK